MTERWRRWIPGAKHGLARGVGVYGAPGPPDGEQLAELLARCEWLRSWARTQGIELENIPDDLPLLDQAIDQAIERAPHELGGQSRVAALGSATGPYLGTVIVAAVPGARWRLWPNGHPVVRLPSGRDMDVVALASDRVRKGSPLLADAYADAAAAQA